jgi:hypothetical protein
VIDNSATWSGTLTTNTGSTSIALIGCDGTGTNRTLIGYLAEAFIWNRAITAGEIASIGNNHNAYYGTP